MESWLVLVGPPCIWTKFKGVYTFLVIKTLCSEYILKPICFWAHKNFSIVLGFHDVSMLCLPQVFVTQPCNQLYNRCSRQKQPLEKAPFLAHATSLEGKRKAANFLSKAKAKTPRRESSRMKMSCFQTFRELCFFLPYLHTKVNALGL